MYIMYILKIVGHFATVSRNGESIAILSGLYVSNEQDRQYLEELIRLANLGLEKENDENSIES
jgi:hypothetical protein